ncbi:MAG: V-type ATPase subunit [Clostridia bacterium]|nr:V-type ATPase subunit [Clostridia bacterium]
MKILDYKLNAIVAKARAMYGQRLTGEDYESLIACSSLAELVTCLKVNKAYADAFENVSATQSEAGYIEFIIKKRAYNRFVSLCRYEMTLGEGFSDYFIVKEEVKQILSCIKSILLGNTEKYVMNMPSFYEKSLHFSVRNLMSVRTLEQLGQTLEGTPYKKIIDRGIADGFSYADYESGLVNYFNEYEYRLVNKNCKGKEKKQMMSLLAETADMQFVNELYRLKKYFPANKALLSVITPSHLTAFSPKEINAMLNAESEKEVVEILLSTPYRKYAEGMNKEVHIEQAIKQVRYRRIKSLLRFGTEPNVIMFCFMLLTENETDNLIHITEGIKYGMNQEEIRALLIGVGD